MVPARPELTVLFTAVSHFGAALSRQLGTATASARLELCREVCTRLPRKYLLSASREELHAAMRSMLEEGRSEQEMRTVQLTLAGLIDELARAGVTACNPLRDADGGEPAAGSGPPEVLLAVRLKPDQVDLTRRLLEPIGVGVHAEPGHREALDRVGWFPFTFVLTTLPSVAPVPFLDSMRGTGSLCRTAGVILLAADRHVEEAAVFIGRGANRVIPVSKLETGLPDVITELGMVSERTKVRLRVYVDLDKGRRSEVWQSENVSATGMLMRTSATVDHGSKVNLQFTVPGDDLPIHAQGVIVRSTTFAREDFPGYAVRFLSFVGEGQHRLALFLGRRSG
jgi:hypothetical protein